MSIFLLYMEYVGYGWLWRENLYQGLCPLDPARSITPWNFDPRGAATELPF